MRLYADVVYEKMIRKAYMISIVDGIDTRTLAYKKVRKQISYICKWLEIPQQIMCRPREELGDEKVIDELLGSQTLTNRTLIRNKKILIYSNSLNRGYEYLEMSKKWTSKIKNDIDDKNRMRSNNLRNEMDYIKNIIMDVEYSI